MSSPASLGDQDLANLARTRGWARFLSVLSFIGMSMMLLALVAMVGLSGRFGAAPFGKLTAAFGVFMGVAVISTGLYGVLNGRYATALYAVDRNRGPALVTAFRNVRLLWMITAVFYGLGLLFSILTIIGTLTGMLPGQPPGTVPPG
jgi:hypothetical protein